MLGYTGVGSSVTRTGVLARVAEVALRVALGVLCLTVAGPLRESLLPKLARREGEGERTRQEAVRADTGGCSERIDGWIDADCAAEIGEG